MLFNSLSLRRDTYDRLWPAMWALLVLTAIILFTSIGPASAQTETAQKRVLTPAALTDRSGDINLAPHTLLLSDPGNRVSPETIRASGGTILTGSMVEGNIINLGVNGTPVWLTVKLSGQSPRAEWILDPGRRADGRVGHLRELKVYWLDISEAGLHVREIPVSSGGVYDISVPQETERIILLHATPVKGRPTTLPLRLYSEKAYISHVEKRSSINTFFCVSFAGIALFFLSYGLARQQTGYALFSANFAIITLAWVLYNSIAGSTGSPFLGALVPLCLLGFIILSVLASRHYWGINERHHTERYILLGLIWLNIAIFAISTILPIVGGKTQALMFYGMPLLTMIILTLMSVAQARNKGRGSHIYAATWVPLIIGLLLTIATSLGWLPHNFLTSNAFWYMFLPHGILLIFAVFLREAETEHATIRREEGTLLLDKLQERKDASDHSRLLKVIQEERKMLAEFRTKEEIRVKEMETAKEEADEANRAKSAFLAVVSHEIRTPMTGVMGMVRLLMDTALTKQQREFALTIQESSEAMLGLLNDILDFEKIQRGKIELENISFDLHRLIQGVITLMSGHAAQKNINLSATISEDLPRFVKGDPTRLRQIILNLMGNAIKFTTEGGVTLSVNLMSGTENDAPENLNVKTNVRHNIYFAIQDSGIGIPADAQKNLFNPFSQASTSITRKFGGTGLGLAISKGLVESMGGTVNINSRDGEGSTFFFTLEMDPGIPTQQEASRPGLAEETRAPLKPLKILVVDDNAITRTVITGFLQQRNHEIFTAGTSEEALSKIETGHFDLVLMDIEMPGMPGNEATKVLRVNPNPAKAKLPVIALTGNVEREYMERYMADGMNGFVTKPIDPDKLHAAINDIFKQSHDRKIHSAAAPIQTPVAQTSITQAPVAEAPIMQAPATETPATQVAPAPPPLSSMPPAASMPPAQAIPESSSLSFDDDDHISIDAPPPIKAQADTYVPAPPPPPAVPEPVEIIAAATDAQMQTPVFKPDVLVSLKDAIGDDQLQEILKDLIAKTDEILEAMITASRDGDLETLSARAHELKGMAGNFGLVEISEIAGLAEKKARAQELDGMSMLVASLPDASIRARDALKEWAEQ